MATNVGRITASHVGVYRTENGGKRTCLRCGGERATNGRTPASKPFMCSDCKSIDRAWARRLGI